MQKPYSHGQQGMTLVEVMVAMAILATAASVMLGSITSEKHRFSTRKMQVVAEWVAQNKLNETLIFEKFPAIGETRGTAENGDMEWFWIQTVKKTSENKLRRIEIEVKDRENSKYNYAFITAFAGQFKGFDPEQPGN